MLQEDRYIAIQYLNNTENYPIEKLCAKLHICRSAYYKWLKRTPSKSQQVNEELVEWIKELYEEQNGILGYRQMTITVNRRHETHFNKKRIRRLMRVFRCSRGLRKPTIAYKQGKEIKGELADKELIHEANYEYTAPNGFHNIVCKNTYQKKI